MRRNSPLRATTEVPPGFTFYPDFLPATEADALFTALCAQVSWERHTLQMFGNTIRMPRQIAWFGVHAYGYSGVVHPAMAIPPILKDLCDVLEAQTGQPYNGILLNRYQDGSDSMGWHRDNDYDAGPHSGIASISLGGTRRFKLRNNQRRTVTTIALTHGSLLHMAPGTQQTWQHSVPRTKAPCKTRINLTFRYMARSNRAP